MRTTHAAAITAALLLALTACGSEDDSKPASPPPAYKVAEQDTTGNVRNVTVEVESTKNLRAVFDDVIKDLDDEAGYHVLINCSTGGTGTSDNRLANGKYAVGNMGAAATGLEEGASEFTTNEGRTCPAS
ncbi:hypothetical protein ACFVTT_34050 [Streptomyces niveus]|uniref:hypothetical protein n=1 Tax=Streptomyces niveus TaxID=193462 RepID=UPI0034268643